MSKHEHQHKHDHCKHARVQYCAEFKVVHCQDCGQEWPEKQTTYVPYTQPIYIDTYRWPYGTYDPWWGRMTCGGSSAGTDVTWTNSLGESGTYCISALPPGTCQVL